MKNYLFVFLLSILLMTHAVFGNDSGHSIDDQFSQALKIFKDASWYEKGKFRFLLVCISAEKDDSYACGFTSKKGRPEKLVYVGKKMGANFRKCSEVDQRMLGQLFAPFALNSLCDKLTIEDPFPQLLGGDSYFIEINDGNQSCRLYRQNLLGSQRMEKDPNFKEDVNFGAEQVVMAIGSYLMGWASGSNEADQ